MSRTVKFTTAFIAGFMLVAVVAAIAQTGDETKDPGHGR